MKFPTNSNEIVLNNRAKAKPVPKVKPEPKAKKPEQKWCPKKHGMPQSDRENKVSCKADECSVKAMDSGLCADHMVAAKSHAKAHTHPDLTPRAKQHHRERSAFHYNAAIGRNLEPSKPPKPIKP